jgi:polysaccharide pyruvyl transferase WcaK-like protein
MVGNLGDYAILQGSIAAFRRHRAETPINVAPYGFPWIDRERTRRVVEALPSGVQIVGPAPYLEAPPVIKFLRRIQFLRHSVNAVHVRLALRKAKRNLAFVSAVRRASLVAMSGGGHWSKDDISVNMLALTVLCRGLNAPIVFLPHSVSPSVSKQVSRTMACDVLVDTQMALRDKDSLELIGQLGAKNAFYVPDLAFSLPGLSRSPERRSRMCLLALRNASWRRVETYRGRYLALLNGLRNLGLSPVLFTTSEGDDAGLHRLLSGYAPEMPRIAPRSVREAMDVFASAELIITDRFHCFVLGILSDAVVIPLRRQSKVAGQARDMEHPVVVDSEEQLTREVLARSIDDAVTIRSMQREFAVRASKQIQSFIGGLTSPVSMR